MTELLEEFFGVDHSDAFLSELLAQFEHLHEGPVAEDRLVPVDHHLLQILLEVEPPEVDEVSDEGEEEEEEAKDQEDEGLRQPQTERFEAACVEDLLGLDDDALDVGEGHHHQGHRDEEGRHHQQNERILDEDVDLVDDAGLAHEEEEGQHGDQDRVEGWLRDQQGPVHVIVEELVSDVHYHRQEQPLALLHQVAVGVGEDGDEEVEDHDVEDDDDDEGEDDALDLVLVVVEAVEGVEAVLVQTRAEHRQQRLRQRTVLLRVENEQDRPCHRKHQNQDAEDYHEVHEVYHHLPIDLDDGAELLVEELLDGQSDDEAADLDGEGVEDVEGEVHHQVREILNFELFEGHGAFIGDLELGLEEDDYHETGHEEGEVHIEGDAMLLLPVQLGDGNLLNYVLEEDEAVD
mmetsp:Transcript_8812/g.8141  ORF Transcript_8812/g.8141 Transcript_8812/m.8141 type:complete len:404 (-) Transcript_8812:256-1467(-)